MHLFSLLFPSFLCMVKSQINDNVYLVNIFITMEAQYLIFYFSKFFNTNLINDLNRMKESDRRMELILHFSAVVVEQYLMFRVCKSMHHHILK
jgi:hypothetical protein